MSDAYANQERLGANYAKTIPYYLRAIFWLSGVVFLGWLIWGDGFYKVTRYGGFSLQEVQIFNISATPREQLLKASGLEQGFSVFAVNLREVKFRIDSLPWVRHSHIVRVLPGSVHIYLTEHRPEAIWQNQGEMHLIAHDGSIIGSVDDLKIYSDLPVISGTDAPESFYLLAAVLGSYPALQNKFIGAKISRAFRWSIYLENGIVVHLPGTNIDEAFVRLEWLDTQFQILSMQSSVIDLRTPDRAAISNNPYQLTPVLENNKHS